MILYLLQSLTIIFFLFVNSSVKGTLLDILLLRASGWKAEEEWDEQQEAASEFTEDEVPSENEVTEVQQQVETGDQSNSAGWN